jgi:hypothetical protein
MLRIRADREATMRVMQRLRTRVQRVIKKIAALKIGCC